MKEQSIIEVGESRPAWEALEAYAREGIRRLLQHVLEKEMEEGLGRRRYELREGVDASPGYRNGFGKPRRLSMMSGTITVRRPRVRGLAARFESRLLPLFKRRTQAVGRLLPELYLHGLAHGDFDLVLRGSLGAAALARASRRGTRGRLVALNDLNEPARAVSIYSRHRCAALWPVVGVVRRRAFPRSAGIAVGQIGSIKARHRAPTPVNPPP